MVFRRAFQRELTQTAVGIFVALFAILVTTQTIRLLNEAAGGKLAPEAVLALLGFSAMHSLPILLSLTLFVATLLVVSRMHRDSEMVVWACSGLPLTGWIVPVLRFALPVVVAVAAISLFVSPWAAAKSAEFRQKINNRESVAQLSPGMFRESSSGERVVFVESHSNVQDRVANVFASSVQHGRLGVMVAREGYREEAPNGDGFLVLDQGRRYELTPGSADFRLLEFSRYAIRIEPGQVSDTATSPKAIPSIDLFRSDGRVERGELAWRLGLPISAALTVILALPLGFVNPRGGRSANLIVALLAFLAYNNAMGIVQTMIWTEKLPFSVGVWIVHAGMALVVLAIFVHRATSSTKPWRRLWA
ncbi:MAG TPA: LPS export ABC transporter permease LptF [Rhodocyclaceae bacterium]